MSLLLCTGIVSLYLSQKLCQVALTLVQRSAQETGEDWRVLQADQGICSKSPERPPSGKYVDVLQTLQVNHTDVPQTFHMQ